MLKRCLCGEGNGKLCRRKVFLLYGVNATIIIFVFVLYCILLYCIVLYCIVLYCISLEVL